MDYFHCHDIIHEACVPMDMHSHVPSCDGSLGRNGCHYPCQYRINQENVTDSEEPMDFSLVSSMLMQRLFPKIVEHEVTSTVRDSPPPGPTLQENKPPKLPPPPPMLPPCRVCGEKASGFHYGANTCEACKGFFRRSLQRKEDYRCIGGGSCEIGVGKRNVCAYCRYQKCIAIGMSKTAIKTGRYTHEKKTRDIREVKRLQNSEKVRDQERLHSVMEFTDTAEYDEKLESIIKHITSVHLQQTPHTREFFEKLPQKEGDFLEQRAFQQEMFGPLKPIPKEEYMKIYQSTGIDIDGRREMIKHMIPCIEKAIKRFINFAKSLPGFKELPINDQISLIKGSRFEAWLVSAHKAFNSNHFLFTHVCGYTLHIDELSKVHDLDFLYKLFKVAARMKELRLSTEEECILKGMSILSRDRCSVEESAHVERCQAEMLQCMLYKLRQTHPKSRNMLPRIISILTDLRTLTELHQKQEEKIGMEWSSDIKFPPLLYEIFSNG